MNLEQAIKGLYPDLKTYPEGNDFELGYDDRGNVVITAWNNPNPRPTEAQLRDGWFRFLKRQKRGEMERRGTDEMQSLLPVYRALLLLARNSADPRFADLRTRDDKITRKIAEVDAATTPEAVEAIRWEA